MASDGRKLSVHTVDSYLEALSDSFVFNKVSRFDIKRKKYLISGEKYYATDVSMRYSLLGRKNLDVGHILENIFYLELLRRGYKVYIGKTGDKEVDFVVNKGYERYYIQSALNIDNDDKKQQELRPLLNVDDFFKKIIIVSKDIPRYKNDSGILIMGIYDFLLNDNSLDY